MLTEVRRGESKGTGEATCDRDELGEGKVRFAGKQTKRRKKRRALLRPQVSGKKRLLGSGTRKV